MSTPAIQKTVQSPELATSFLWALNAQRLIGRRIQKRMDELDFTDEGVAQRTGLTTKTIWRLRNGKSYPRVNTAQRVADALSLNLSDLRPPQSPDEEPELRELLQDALSRLRRIEDALPTDAPAEEEVEEAVADLERDEGSGHSHQTPAQETS